MLLEDLHGQFRTFGENLEDVRGRLAAVEAEVKEFNRSATFQRLVSEKLRDDVGSLTTMSRKITADIASIKDDLKALTDRLTSAEAKLPA